MKNMTSSKLMPQKKLAVCLYTRSFPDIKQ
ncbi:hypothetical protein GGR15_001221 [Butyricimonas paravirosa]|uniref:Uncharacterized protein n=1 Tax=Butyricimonas paravirosa TaxID=1472417 RepID=A0A7X6BJ27_9BACT|nr:hypothetical protein [Butyricimonas paravirosa]